MKLRYLLLLTLGFILDVNATPNVTIDKEEITIDIPFLKNNLNDAWVGYKTKLISTVIEEEMIYFRVDWPSFTMLDTNNSAKSNEPMSTIEQVDDVYILDIPYFVLTQNDTTNTYKISLYGYFDEELDDYVFFADTNELRQVAPINNNPADKILKLPRQLDNYSNISLPTHFLEADIKGIIKTAPILDDTTPENNPTTDAGATLGRVLFYDKKLSKNNTIACASCHKQEFAFSDNNALSTGFNGDKTKRHSPRLVNTRFYQRNKFFWDERAGSLEKQVLMPFQDKTEMGLALEELIQKVEQQSYYAPLFVQAFGDSEITAERISKALSQFIRSLVSYTSKYDEGRAQVKSPEQDFPNFTTLENKGKRLFMLKRGISTGPDDNSPSCVSCHYTESFGTEFPTNNGLTAGLPNDDAGIGSITKKAEDQGTFKVPSLRNVAVSGSFMHDGRFKSIDEVIEHYSRGIKAHPNLDVDLFNEQGEPFKFNFTDDEKKALKAFLHTLTDKKFLTDEKFSNPFVN